MTPAGPADAVRGVQPSLVARPTSTEEVSTTLAAASRDGMAVIPRGAGTTLAWGPPPERADLILDTTGLAGVVEHVAGDLMVAVRAGTRLVDLQAALAPAGQRLALDGHDHDAATLGGLVAHGLSGPSRLGYGTLRDLLIGATFVRADGVVAHTGGRVVKNVAGYDLGKLLHGSWGTVGVLTELTFRLHPRPQATRWVTVPGLEPDDLAVLTWRVLHSQLVPAAVEVERPPGGPAALAVQLDGQAATVAARAEAVAGLVGASAAVSEEPPAWWGRRPRSPLAGGPSVLLRVTTEVASLSRLLTALDAAAAATELPVHLRGSAGAGSLLAAVDSSAEVTGLADLVTRLRQAAADCGGTVVVLDGPSELLRRADPWGPIPALDLMRRVKAQFDPDRRLSPGRFVGGI